MDVVCLNDASFDIAATAGLYSALTGVLAGFAFTALILVPSLVLSTGRRLGEEVAGHIADAARVLVSAFLALVLASINYAVLGGEPTSGGRAAAGELLAGVGLAVAAILMIYAIVLTLETVAELADGTGPLMRAAESSA
ncbi:hypothetical protein [Kribbella ginsengisoli]|uniref:Uncharacterized protein n=1 Tax=Kribbella ginsengisoli TaxID=363865 RepID=A0ABP6VQ04_9ACTN